MLRKLAVILVIITGLCLWGEDVTFNVNMNYQDSLGTFDPEVDYVDVAGNFNDWNGSGAMTDPENDGIYTVTVSDLDVNYVCEFKFRINGDWNTSEFPGGGANRFYTVIEGENIVDLWYNDEEPALVFVDVVFTIEDGTQNYLDIKFKSSFDEWVLHQMADDGVAPDETAGDHIWTVQIEDIPNGSWEWGAIEDDGSAYGIWLIEGPNLQLTVDEVGNVSGQTEYFIDPGTVQDVTVTFQLDTSLMSEVGSITIAGDFNSWNMTTHEMVYNADEELWLLDVLLPTGSQVNQEYKYLNDGTYEDIENRLFVVDDTGTEQLLPVDHYNNMDPANYLTQSITLTINVDVEDTVFDSIAVCGNVAPLDWEFAAHNYPLTLVEGTTWSVDIVFMEGTYRYLQFKFTTDGQDQEAGFDENHTCTLDESGTTQTVNCIYGEMGPVLDKEESIIGASSISLSNYPNPFNPETTLQYQIPVDQTAEIVICNLKGQRLRKWKNITGNGSLVWNGRNEDGNLAGSGVFLAIIKSAGEIHSSKMILLK